MLIIHSDATRHRRTRTELFAGQLVAPFECPERVDYIIDRARAEQLGEIRPPDSHGLEPVLAIHDKGYIDFLKVAWRDWQAAGYEGEAIPNIWPTRRMPGGPIPRHIEGRLGYYALAGETSLTAETFEAALLSKDIALTALDHVLAHGEPAFALCRPPGHHAARDQYGGYCFINNVAVAAQQARHRGCERVAILDIDFHHGNGTQDIFYERSDVMTLSLHGDPMDEFPYFLGFANETGHGEGSGFNVNYPLPSGTDFPSWLQALEDATGKVRHFSPELLIIALGVDTFENDPISSFTLKSEDYLEIGARIKRLGLPTLFVMEGGYAVEEIGINAVNVLKGFDAA
ncbi:MULTISPECIES: histone deacetylase family protein [unclassified Halomonas]|uniref:histone deacetylase family protein n=1 Tax=unclassified Halomonas TaxID=2609666 RepID=UPI001C981622|nr:MULTISPECIES: histone deacetylase family protein [unclassified Halomonas]MBY5924160.1 histone deacetylase family protein [Halomonas sp. DP4Y7-2]MBY6231202.1 histone deacetylase family protein [Halomonas sp. DP4Y7-1]MED5294202.1 histone deacetylase family protein [Pseudomonadota bacterium]